MPKNSFALSAAALALLFVSTAVLQAQPPIEEQMLVSPKLEERCSIDAVPAATLLFPYFSVDVVANPDGSLRSDRNVTTFSVTNADSAPHLAHLTLWTNWALPTLSFDFYLAGYDVATFNVFDLLTLKAFERECDGPDEPGPLSADNVVFPGCGRHFAGQALFAPPHVHPDLVRALELDPLALVQAHMGHMVLRRFWADRTPLVWAEPHPVDVATGYVTVDVANRCSESFPSDPGYFARGGRGIASNENVLMGEWLIYEPAGERASGDTAVHVRADERAFEPGDYTFYGRYVDGDASDGRQPLGTVFASRFITRLGFADSVNTYLLVWRDTKQMPGGPMGFGYKPAWYPLSTGPVLIFDETSQLAMVRSTEEAPLATQSVDLDFLGMPFDYGWLKVDLNHRASDLFEGAAQGWVTMLIGAGMERNPPSGHVGTGCRAFRLESPCDYR